MGRAENAAVFEDTMRLCKTDEEIRDAIKKSIEGQKLILETDTFTAPAKDKYAEPAQLKVSKKRTLEAAAGYKDYKVCAHNFASATNPGVVARAAKNVIPDYCHAFRTIEFAVYCRPDDERNYKVFERILK